MAIPRRIHRAWAGHDIIPYRLRSFGESWTEHHPHPDWEHRLWTPDQIESLDMINQDLYDNAHNEAPRDWLRWRADIARLEILYRYGGIYVDMDTECLKPLDPLLDRQCWFAESPNAPEHATNAVFGAEPGHPFVKHLLDTLAGSARANKTKRINHRVGSRFVARELGRRGRDLGAEMLPWQWFSGQSIKNRDSGRGPDLSQAYCWHRYDNTDRHGHATKQIEAFTATADALNNAGVTWFLNSGMLLGHVRDGRIIEWDRDIDIGIWPGDVNTVRKVFRKKRWRPLRDRESQFQPQHPNGTKIDIHTHYRDESSGTVYKLHGKRENIRMDYPAYLFDDMRPSIFYLRDVLLPSPPEEYLEVMYGSDWLTPKREWVWDQSPHNITRLPAPSPERSRR